MDVDTVAQREMRVGQGTTSMAATAEHIRIGRRVSLLVSAVLAVAGGLIAASLLPRGPISTTDALLWMAGTFLVGLVSAFVLGSRWSMIVTPMAFMAAFELGRLSAVGPTVDGIHLGSTYGIIAFVVGRGVTYFLALGPLLIGSVLGVELAVRRQRGSAPRLGVIGWLLTSLAATAVLVLAVSIARPGVTPAIVNANGQPLQGSIAELTSVPLGGREQALMIRGRSTDAPVLLHLAGGPGGTDMGAMRADTSLEDDFIVVTWDQRGTGKSYAALDPVGDMTLEQMVADTVELTEYLRERFDEDAIYLHGQSWGSTLGVLAVQQRPDLYHAFIGSGQMVSQAATDLMFWEDTATWARAAGDDALVEALMANGPPPYQDILAYETALSHEHDWNPYPEWDSDKEMPFNLFVPENAVMDYVNGLRAFLDTFSVLYPQLQDIDFRDDVRGLEVPFFMIAGAHEAHGRAVLADQWFEMVGSPIKERYVFEHSGHRPNFEEPQRFKEVMVHVAAITGHPETDETSSREGLGELLDYP